MKQCEEMLERISLLLDGELPEQEAEAVRAHIAACPDCAAFYEAVSGLGAALAPEEVPAGLHEKIMGRVDRAAKVQTAQRRFRVLRPTLAAAACLLVIVGTIFLTGRGARLRSESVSASAGGAAESTVTAGASFFASGSASSAKAAAAPMAPAIEANEQDDGYYVNSAESAPAAAAESAAEEPMVPQMAADATGADGFGSSMTAVTAATLPVTGTVEQREDDRLTLVLTEDCAPGNLAAGDRIIVCLPETVRENGMEEADEAARRDAEALAEALQEGVTVTAELSFPLPAPEESAPIWQAASVRVVGDEEE